LIDLLAHLTAAQRDAVEHRDGPLLVLAGPGSGKTRVITHRVARLLEQGVPAGQILALTFTNKAADEMRSRVAALAPGERVWMSTFHRFCARLLRQHAALVGLEPNYAIYDTADSGQVLRQAVENAGLANARFTPEQLAAAISAAKNSLRLPGREARRGDPLERVLATVYAEYQALLLRSNAVDFDDLLLHVATLLRDNDVLRAQLDARFRYLLVDEYQDTNLAQYAIVRALSQDNPNLCVTGDPDQSIYGWRGANVRNILDFEHDYPQVRVVRLEQNYRSTQRILAVADRLIAHNRRRKLKGLFTENPPGGLVRLVEHASHQSEAAAIADRIAREVAAGRRRPRDFAVFYRTNALSRELEKALHLAGVPFQLIHSVEFYQRKEIKDALSYLALLNNPRDDVALLRVINTPTRGIGKATIARLVEHAAERKIPLLEAARSSGLIAGLPARAPVAVAAFVALVDRLNLLIGRPVREILEGVLQQSGYADALRQAAEEDDERLANLEELLTAAGEFDNEHPGSNALEEFLEQACLVNDTDGLDGGGDRATLMTLHAAKGLEFPVVFIVALEEGILPHSRSRDDPAQLEEERRLLFVGITRAREELELSLTRWRDFRGRSGRPVASSFTLELTGDEVQFEREAGAEERPARGLPPSDEAAQSFHDDAAGEDQTVRVAPRREPATRKPAALHLTTAAALAGEPSTTATRAVTLELRAGSLVRHPEFGLGTVVSVWGSGPRRTATVRFLTGAGERKFVLAHCPLEPAAG
jgi:DNA helicase-2/ATP-dependent DNA helicase PcrA